MCNRTPSYVVAGLVLVIILLGFFYTSCSSTSAELRRTLSRFEKRVQTLTLQALENDRKFDDVQHHKEKLTDDLVSLKEQLNRKDTTIRSLKAKFDERKARLDTLKSDNQVLDEQLKEFKKISEALAVKNLAVERLQKEFNEQKQLDNDKLLRMMEELENYKFQLNISQTKLNRSLKISNEHILPLLPTDELSNDTTTSVLQQPLDQINDVVQDIKQQIGPLVSNIRTRVANAFRNQNNASANQISPTFDNKNQTQVNRDGEQKLQLPLNESLASLNRSKVLDGTETDQTKPLNLTRTSVTNSTASLGNQTFIANNQSLVIPRPLLAAGEATTASMREPLAVIDKNNTLDVQQRLVTPVKSIDVANRTKEDNPKQAAA